MKFKVEKGNLNVAVSKIRSFYLSENFNRAYRLALDVETFVEDIKEPLHLLEFYYYYSLILTAVYDALSEEKQGTSLQVLAGNNERLRDFDKQGLLYATHKYHLVHAEILRLNGNDLEAIDSYNRAIRSAREKKDYRNQGLANELAAEYFLRKGKDYKSNPYILQARECYIRCKQAKKIKKLETKFSPLLKAAGVDSAPERKRDISHSEILDWHTVINASQMISTAIDFESLMVKLMRIMIQNAGAQRGFFILEEEIQEKGHVFSALVINARGVVFGDNINVSVGESIPLVSRESGKPTSMLSTAVVNFVKRTHKNIVIGDALQERLFRSDPYISDFRPKSILCFPILKQNRFIGILYFENNLTSHVFTPQRVEVLKILSAQAAISIENANFYKERINLQEIKEKQLQTELNLLKSQVNPHFLFNTLNNLYALSLDQSEALPDLILKLSSLMRYLLESSRRREVQLFAECDFIHNYLALEELRLRSGHDIRFEISGDLRGKMIAPMILIPFVENCFKHGLSASIDQFYVKVHLLVEGNTLTFSVKNSKDGNLIPDKKTVSGTGLKNVKRRLGLLYPNRNQLEITNESDSFSINLEVQL